MDKKPSVDIGLIIPIILGACSVFGICLVLLLGRLSATRTIKVADETATPFKFLFLGTEPGISTTTPEEEGTATEAPTSTAIEFIFASPTSEVVDINTPAPSQLSSTQTTKTPTEESSSTAPLNPGTYDEVDGHIAYDGDWIPQTGVAGVFQNTLHVSNTLGNSLTLRFIGEQIRIFYQSGVSLGTVRINLDGIQFDLDESANTTTSGEWVSPLLINGTHSVTITHISGGAINLDYFIVPETIKTPTSTSTP